MWGDDHYDDGERHPSDADLIRFSTGRSSLATLVPITAHLRHCPLCRSRFLRLAPASALAFEDAERESIAHAETDALGSEVARSEAVEVLARQGELEKYSEAHRGLLIDNWQKYRSPLLVVSLLGDARAAWHTSLTQARQHVETALRLLQQAEGDDWPKPLHGLLLARAWACSGNVHRIRGDLQLAEKHLHQAEMCRPEGLPDRQGQVDWLWYLAALRSDQRRFDQAREILETAIHTAEEGRISEVVLAELTLTLAVLLRHQDQLGKAIELLQGLLPRLSPSHPALFLSATQTLAVFYALAGKPTEARRRLPDIRSRAERLGHKLHLLRVDWLEGLINTAEGNREVAEAFFRDVQQGFVQAGSPLNAALVSLDWAALLLQHGDTAAAGELAAEMLPIFEALEIEREVLMSLRLLTESLQRQAASVADVKDAARELGLARRVRKPAG